MKKLSTLDASRARAAADAYRAHKTVEKAAAALGVSRRTMQRWLRLAEKGGLR